MSRFVLVLIAIIHLILISDSYSSIHQTQTGMQNLGQLPQLDHVLVAIDEVLHLPPVSQSYYPRLFSFDSALFEYCSTNTSFGERFPSLSELGVKSCTDLLCDKMNQALLNLTSISQLDEVDSAVNACLYCGTTDSQQEFVSIYNNGSCNDLDRIFNQVEFTTTLKRHCNAGDELKDLPLFDYEMLTTPFFVRKLEIYQKNQNLTVNTKSVSLYETFSFFHSLSVEALKDPNRRGPFRLPALCWCNYQDTNTQTKSFAFYCNDAYHLFFIPLSYRAVQVIFFTLFGGMFLFVLFAILLPRCVERFKKFKNVIMKDTSFVNSNLITKFGKVLTHVCDIVMHPPIMLCMSSLCGAIENLFRFIFNFSQLKEFNDHYFSGLFRGISAVFVVCAYSSLVISWSHVIDLSSRKDASKKLSVVHKTILTLFYISVISVLIISGIVFAAVSDYGYAWIVMGASVPVFLLTFVIGFFFYGMKIFLTLRKRDGNAGILEYRFTKFILFISIFSVGVWIICFLNLFTYILGYDILGLFWGITRNIFLDTSLLMIITISTYITLNEESFRMMYGDRVMDGLAKLYHSMMGCKRKKLLRDNSPVKEIPSTSSSSLMNYPIKDQKQSLNNDSSPELLTTSSTSNLIAQDSPLP